MATKKTTEPKSTLEREYIVPLRKGWLKVPEYKRASKAIKTLKEFIAKHMKLYDTDLRKVKIDQILNNEIRFRGMRKPPARIKVKATKLDNDTIRVELVDIPTHVKFSKLKKAKQKAEIKKKIEEKEETKKIEEPTKEKEDSKKDTDTKEDTETKKEETKVTKELQTEESLKTADQEAKRQKHTSKEKQVKVHRKALSR